MKDTIHNIKKNIKRLKRVVQQLEYEQFVKSCEGLKFNNSQFENICDKIK